MRCRDCGIEQRCEKCRVKSRNELNAWSVCQQITEASDNRRARIIASGFLWQERLNTLLEIQWQVSRASDERPRGPQRDAAVRMWLTREVARAQEELDESIIAERRWRHVVDHLNGVESISLSVGAASAAAVSSKVDASRMKADG